MSLVVADVVDVFVGFIKCSINNNNNNNNDDNNNNDYNNKDNNNNNLNIWV